MVGEVGTGVSIGGVVTDSGTSGGGIATEGLLGNLEVFRLVGLVNVTAGGIEALGKGVTGIEVLGLVAELETGNFRVAA